MDPPPHSGGGIGGGGSLEHLRGGEDAALGLAGVGSLSLWLFIIPPLLFFSFSPPPFPAFLLRSGRSQAAGAGSAQPPSILPPSLSPIPPFSLKTWAPGCSPLRWQHPCLREEAPYPPLNPLHHRLPLKRSLQPCPQPFFFWYPPHPSPAWGYLDAAGGSTASLVGETHTQVRSQLGFIFNFGLFFYLFTRAGAGEGRLYPSPSGMLRWLLEGTVGRGGDLGVQNRMLGLTDPAGR